MRSSLAFLLTFLSAPALAGGMSTGGGSAVVCRDSSNAIVSAELLDVFEGRERFHMTVPERSSQPEDQVQAALAKLEGAPGLKGYIDRSYKDLYARRIFLPTNIGLNASNDLGRAYAVYIIDGCRLEQVGYYEADGQLRVATAVFSHLSPTSQAGFLLHETLYRLTRLMVDAEDSASARKLVAELLATSTSSEQVTADVEKTMVGDPDVRRNVFLSVPYRAGADFTVHVAVVCGGLDAKAAFLNISGDVLDSLTFKGDDTQTFRGNSDVSQINFRPAPCSDVAFEIYYDGQLVHQQKRGASMNLGYNVFIAWQGGLTK